MIPRQLRSVILGRALAAASTGFPDATNTGVPAGTSLSASGGITTSSNNQVIQNLDITGNVVVNHTGVTLKNCRITKGSESGFILSVNNSGFTCQDCEINGNETSANGGFIFGTYLRCNIYGVENGLMGGAAGLVQDCYIHDLQNTGSPHIDGIQFQNQDVGGCIIRHNTIKSWDTSCIFLKPDASSINNVTIENNLLICDGTRGLGCPSYTIYVDNSPGNGINGTIIRNNILQSGVSGYYSIVSATATGTGNVDYFTGATVDP